MKTFKVTCLFACLLLLLGAMGMTATGQAPIPRTPFAPPRPPFPAAAQADIVHSRILDLPSLKAVLIAGPIDGDTGQWTLNEIDNMEDAAAELEANGVEVHRFYTPNNNWSQIKQAAIGAHFLFYRGHGVYWSSFPYPTVGGFALKSQFVSSDDIRQDLHLAPGAIVMLYGCFTAGHSSDPSDAHDIGVDEAKRRVAQYSDPFFDVGAAGYYADWFGNAFQMFVRYLFQGQTLGQAYESYFDFNPSTVYRTTHPDHPEMAMWLDKDYWDGYWQYNNAFVGLPNETLESLFAPPTLGNLPDAVHFTYSIPDRELLPAAHQVTPLNVGNGEPLTWTLSIGSDQFLVGPLAGVTPASFWITPTTFSTETVAIYTGAVTVTVVDPAGTPGSPQRIDLTLQVAATPLSRVYLPLVARGYVSPMPLARYSNDPYYNSQWALAQIEAPAAWGISTGQGVLIAVIDSGADLDHPDLAGKVRSDIDWDYVNGDDVADDDNGHGSHVSGIAGAATDNATGIAGLGWEAAILPLKILDASGNGYSDDLAAAIRYAADHGADVINMSLGGATSCPFEVQEAVDYAYARGAVLVAAAGNYQGRTEDFPANCTHVLGVSATNSDDSFASYSNYGGHVSVAAPGSSIYSTLPGGAYGTMGGTSMASPHVAGLAALLCARYPAYTPDQIASAILDNALDLGTAGWDERYGCGRINAFQALCMGAHGDSPLCLAGVGQPFQAAYRRADRRVGRLESLPYDAAVAAPFAPGEIIVSFRSGIAAQAVPQEYVAGAEFLPAIGAWRLRVTPGEEQATIARLLADPAVVYAEPNYLVSAQ